MMSITQLTMRKRSRMFCSLESSLKDLSGSLPERATWMLSLLILFYILSPVRQAELSWKDSSKVDTPLLRFLRLHPSSPFGLCKDSSRQMAPSLKVQEVFVVQLEESSWDPGLRRAPGHSHIQTARLLLSRKWPFLTFCQNPSPQALPGKATMHGNSYPP